MRITDDIRSTFAMVAGQRAGGRLQEASLRANSGLQVDAPSDDPAAYAERVRMDLELSSLRAQKTAASRAEGDAALAEGQLASAADVLVRARQIATQLANGSVDAATRTGLVAEARHLRETLHAIANARGAQGYLFSGSATNVQPFDTAGVFVGNDDPVEIAIGSSARLRVNASGANAFTAAGGRDLFADFTAFENALAANDVTAIRTAIGHFDDGERQVTRARGDVGLVVERLQATSDVLGMTADKVTASRASLVEGDAARLYSEFADARSAYERSLSISRELLSISAVDKR